MDTKIPNHSTLRTPADVLKYFHANGITVTGWSREHGFSRSIVNALLHRGTPGLRGQAHRAAIALGLKAAPQQGYDHEC